MVLHLAGGQYAWNYFFWERCISEPKAQQFLDLTTVAKVSVFVLDAEYHGWYLHGDAPFSHSDDTMNQLTSATRCPFSPSCVDGVLIRLGAMIISE